MQQGQAVVGNHEHGETDDAQRLAPLPAVAALRERCPVDETVDEGEEVGGIEQHLPQVNGKPVNLGRGDVALDVGDGVLRGPVHVVPEPPAGQLPWPNVQPVRQDGRLEPVADAGLRAGSHAAVEAGGKQIGSDGDFAATLGDMAVDVFHQAQLGRDVEQCGDGTEFPDDGMFGLAVLYSMHDVFGPARPAYFCPTIRACRLSVWTFARNRWRFR